MESRQIPSRQRGNGQRIAAQLAAHADNLAGAAADLRQIASRRKTAGVILLIVLPDRGILVVRGAQGTGREARLVPHR